MAYGNVDMALWSLAELCSGLVCACLPVLRPLLGDARRRCRRRSWRPPVPPKDNHLNTTSICGEKPNAAGWPGRATAAAGAAAPLRPVLSRLNPRYEARSLEAAPPAVPSREHVAWHMRRPDPPRSATGSDRLHGIMGILSGPGAAGGNPRAARPALHTAEREVGLALPCPSPTYFPTQAHYQRPHRWRSVRGARVIAP